jgi:hypothetical protein
MKITISLNIQMNMNIQLYEKNYSEKLNKLTVILISEN